MGLIIITILPPVVTKDFPISPRFTPYFFLSRCKKFNNLTTRQPKMVEFYLLTFPRFPLQKKEHKSYFSKNRTHDFLRTTLLSRCCEGYLLLIIGDHSIERQGHVKPQPVSVLNRRGIQLPLLHTLQLLLIMLCVRWIYRTAPYEGYVNSTIPQSQRQNTRLRQ